jgi:hypothetical protein
MDCVDAVFRTQLAGGPTQGEDCGVVAAAIALDFMTCGKVDKGVRQLRRAMGVESGPTRTVDQETALRAFALDPERIARLRERGFRPPRVRRRVLVPFEVAREALRRGHGLVIPLSYRVVNRKRPGLSGDRGFLGMHSVFAAAIREDGDGSRSWLIHDPLYNVPGDPRRPVPTGPQWWPEWLVRRAAGRMSVILGQNADGGEIRGEVGIGRIVCVEVVRPRLRRPDEPEIEEEEEEEEGGGQTRPGRGPRGGVRPADGGADHAEELARARLEVARLKAQLADLEAENSAAEARIEELEAAVGAVAAAVASVADGAAAETAA